MEENSKVVTVAENVDKDETVAVDLDHALAVAGIGQYNLKYCLALALFLIAAIVEPVGYSFVLPAAVCDLDMSDSVRGFIASIPYIGIVLTSFPWGYLVDTRGRKRVVIYSSLAAGVLSMLSAFMPNLITFTICKFLTSLWEVQAKLVFLKKLGTLNKTQARVSTNNIQSLRICKWCSGELLRIDSVSDSVQMPSVMLLALFLPRMKIHNSALTHLRHEIVLQLRHIVVLTYTIAGPAAVPYTFIGEILPQRYRDVTLSITNALQITGSALVPLLAWGILPLDFRINFGSYYFRSWRLLVIVYASIFIIAAVLLSFGPESPKYLISQRRHDEALKVLQTIYAGNKKKSPQEYPVKKLKMDTSEKHKISFITSLKVQTVPILKPPFLKWLALNGFLLFGIFSVLNGLYMWVPDILNRVLTGSGAGLTACEVIAQRLNETAESGECVDTIDEITYLINSVANISCAVIAVAVSSTVKIIGKKNLLIIVYLLIGTFCILINFITEDMLFAVLLSSFPIMGLAIGPVNAYAVEIFPTHLRGMAVSLSMMLGRMGSVLGTNVAGIMLNAACEATFYSFGGLLIVCGGLSLLLPNSRSVDVRRKSINTRL